MQTPLLLVLLMGGLERGTAGQSVLRRLISRLQAGPLPRTASPSFSSRHNFRQQSTGYCAGSTTH